VIDAGVAEALDAQEPPEVRGAERADVAMLVASRSDGALIHARFGELRRFLRPGDLLVVNTSATLPAALPARLHGADLLLHVSTPADAGNWVVELRTADLMPFRAPRMGARLDLPGGAKAELLAPYLGSSRLSAALADRGIPDRLRR
jgi:S-adenosylmethionine:tRNA ribosyltransferase-isomerase